jgi:hypothetical protein
VDLSWTPWFAELFQPQLVSRVVPPSEMRIDPGKMAPPAIIRPGANRYHMPGCLDDLLNYVSCVVACHAAIHRAWVTLGAGEDCGPPDHLESEHGSFGDGPWRKYWIELSRRLAMLADITQPAWVLHLDVVQCAASLDPAVLSGLLHRWQADEAAIEHLEVMHRAWNRRGEPGLPVTSTFSMLQRLYFLDIDRELRERGIRHVRIIDDFRIICRAPDEREQALRTVAEVLANRGLRLNLQKQLFYRHGSSDAAWQRRRLAIAGKLNRGLVRPAVVATVRWPAARPAAFALLTWMGRRR